MWAVSVCLSVWMESACVIRGGAFENVTVLAAIAVNEDGCREVLGAAKGMKEGETSWAGFFQ